MKIDSLSQLKKLIRMCRDEGVNHIVIDNMTISIEGAVKEINKHTGSAFESIQDASPFDPGKIDTPDFPSQEQLLFGSADPSVWQEKN